MGVTGSRIVLTADRTLMSNYNGSMFIGFAACFPRVLPKWLYTRLFCPAPLGRHGTAECAPGGLRKIEAALLNSGFGADEVAVAHSERIGEVAGPETRVVGITSSDPLGLGPASSTFSSLLRRETYTAFFFRTTMDSVKRFAPNAKVVVGGPGAWQLGDPTARARVGIDCLVEGEGELVAPQIFSDAAAGRPIPETVAGGPVPVEQIPMVAGPTINGLVEVSRGCGRGCEFCSPNMRVVRHIPLERILAEVRLNLEAKPKITLHAEDVLRYKSKGIKPDRASVLRLFHEVLRLTPEVGISHFALSSALSDPKLIEELSVMTGAKDGRRHLYGQTGIETGSPDVVSKHMRGKAKPFDPDRWPEVVEESFKLLSDNNWIPCGTLVMGLPGERSSDVERTLDLVRNLREYKCLIVPLFFVPLGELRQDRPFRPDQMLPEHWMLFAECIDHDFRWVGNLMDELFAQNRLSSARSGAFKLAAWYMQRRLKPSMELMRAGRDPRSGEEEIERGAFEGQAHDEQMEA